MSETKAEKLYALFAIVERGKEKKLLHCLEKNGVEAQIMMHGRGTARTEVLEYLGIADIERSLVICGVPEAARFSVLESLNNDLRTKRAGAGILFTVPVDAVGGAITLRLLLGNVALQQAERTSMSTQKGELVITVVGRGYAADVVEAARRVGAKGGTVIKGRASGDGDSMKFYGITVEPQKDVVFMVVPKEIKTDVMRAVCRDVGLKTPGKGISFSLPVSDILGAYGFENTIPDEDVPQ